MLSMEQELVRAHQRATKSYSPISACSVLLERLQPRSLEHMRGGGGGGGGGGRGGGEGGGGGEVISDSPKIEQSHHM